MADLPSWPGASICYSRAYIVLGKMGAANYASYRRSKGFSRKKGPAPTEDMALLTNALDRGDEESIKGFLGLHYAKWLTNEELVATSKMTGG